MFLISLFSLLLFVKVVVGEEPQDETTQSNLIIVRDNNSSSKKHISEALYAKAHSYFINTKIYKNYSIQDTIQHVNEVVNWEAPRELQEKFPYYQSGYDYEDQPVWIAEVGKYNVREQVEKGPEAAQNLSRYLFQGVFRLFESMIVKDSPTKEIRNVFVIGDWEGLDITQSTHLPTVRFAMHLLRTYREFLALGIGYAIGLNVNYVTTLMFESIRPILGGLFEKIELYGTNPAKWKIALQKFLPLSAIPTCVYQNILPSLTHGRVNDAKRLIFTFTSELFSKICFIDLGRFAIFIDVNQGNFIGFLRSRLICPEA
ncbi:unnamed protein product [Allacma fusca]|uniref:CRAL-TRIO domain-containing protein n=1 Tax=Allacma fusca TaxID=39272 RepID=A0A8J2PF87_9HEXA|nr:unnamed protein product [Allacma fusca]